MEMVISHVGMWHQVTMFSRAIFVIHVLQKLSVFLCKLCCHKAYLLVMSPNTLAHLFTSLILIEKLSAVLTTYPTTKIGTRYLQVEMFTTCKRIWILAASLGPLVLHFYPLRQQICCGFFFGKLEFWVNCKYKKINKIVLAITSSLACVTTSWDFSKSKPSVFFHTHQFVSLLPLFFLDCTSLFLSHTQRY